LEKIIDHMILRYLYTIILFVSLNSGTLLSAPLTNNHDIGRKIIPLNHQWTFYQSFDFANPQKTHVSLPHSWNASAPITGEAKYDRSRGIYQKYIQVSKELLSKRLFLNFEGANSVAQLFVNNRFIGEHKGGYTAFSFEISSFLIEGQNQIEVHVSNEHRMDVIPLIGDFNVYGGIHRPVSLIVTEPNCITLLDYGSSGIFITQKKVRSDIAEIEVKSKLSLTKRQPMVLRTVIRDQKGKKIKEAKERVQFEKSEVIQYITIDNPTLWDGKENPYLYSVEVCLLQNDNVVDNITQPMGLRYFSVDSDKGFFLNGSYLDLHGAGMHLDKYGKGSALSSADLREDMDLIMDLGATAMRLTHYPYNKEIYDMSDKEGLVLWTEIPLVGPGGFSGFGYYKNADLENHITQVLIEMIRQNYNHPSVFFWGLGNELALKGDSPEPFLRELNKIAKQEDPNRLTTFASNLSDSDFQGISDLLGWNKYYGWYNGKFTDIAMWADNVHRSLPAVPICISEYGAGASPFVYSEQHQKPSPTGRFHPEQWQTDFHEEHWQQLKSRPFIFGKFIWALADFGSSIRTEGDKNGINDKGLVTYDRKIKKDAYYFYKANWNPDPLVYIVNKKFVERSNLAVSVKAYSNLPKVELWINGERYSQKSPNGISIVVWDNVSLKEGSNHIIVKGERDNIKFEDECYWNFNLGT